MSQDEEEIEVKMKYSNEQLTEIVNNLFDQFDVNKNNYIDRNEVKALVQLFFQKCNLDREPTESEIDEFVAYIDLNKDGKLSRQELHIYLNKYM